MTPILMERQIRRLAEAAEQLVKNLPASILDLKPTIGNNTNGNKKRIVKEIEVSRSKKEKNSFFFSLRFCFSSTICSKFKVMEKKFFNFFSTFFFAEWFVVIGILPITRGHGIFFFMPYHESSSSSWVKGESKITRYREKKTLVWSA